MAGHEYQPQEVVAYIIVESGVEVFHLDLAGAHLASIEFAAELFVLALEPCVSAEMINRAVLGSGHQPGAGVIRDTRLRPLLKGCDESILCEIFGQTDIPHDPRQPGDEPR